MIHSDRAVPSSSPAEMKGRLSLIFKGILVSLTIIDLDDWNFLQGQRDDFLWSLVQLPTDSEGPRSPVEVVLSFIRYLLDQEATPPSALRAVVRAFDDQFLRDSEVHAVIAQITKSPAERGRWLETYYRAACTTPGAYTGPQSALLQEALRGNFQLVGIFGGQGSRNTLCIQELRELYNTYQPFLGDLFRVAGGRLRDLSRSPEASTQLNHPLDLESWMRDPQTTPTPTEMAEAPVSMPITGLLSLARYAVSCHLLGLTPGQLGSHFNSFTGHSQGILTAVVVALSDTWASFYHYAEMALELLFWIGFQCYKSTPRASLPANTEKSPSCMLDISGMQLSQAESTIAQINEGLDASERVHTSVVNTRDRVVIGGPAGSLARLDSYLTSIAASSNNQNRVPFSSRKPIFSHGFLPISIPFHTPHLNHISTELKTRFTDKVVIGAQLRLSVRHTRTGHDIKQSRTANLIPMLIDAILLEICDWPAALALPESTTHILSFDPSMAPLAKLNVDGRGMRIISALQTDTQDEEIGNILDLLSPSLLDSSTKIRPWGQRFRPRLSASAGGLGRLETRLTELLGTPPVMVAGMTPTTAHWDVVSAIVNAGYHTELAGGGYYKEGDLSAAVKKVLQSIPQGRGVTVNLIYADPKAISWQIPLLQQLSRNQYHIQGLTIGAGVPSADVVAEYINSIGIQHISLKPGSVPGIRDVIDIAKAHPNFPVIMQWTGGRGGGHHSFEDFHAPILSMYAAIRRCTNIYLVAGSGFGSADDIYPYLTGTWSVELGYPKMPFDGVLLGSRMMVSKEAHTSQAVKELICNTPGVPDNEWEKTYTGSAGGIVTVKSEMGEPIHKIANRGVMLWAEMDKTVFKLPREDRIAYLEKNKKYIIERLNSDYAKPWFGRDSKANVVDISQMTYIDVLRRLVELMYVDHQKRWINASYTRFVQDIAFRTLERLAIGHGEAVSTSVLEDDPHLFLESLVKVCPLARFQLLSPEDASFFIARCKQGGQKPVNFIPTLDEDFEFYFKKDSLWQSEDLDAVVGQDASRVCVLHGPVAAPYSTRSDESAQDILDGIVYGLIDRFQKGRRRIGVGCQPESRCQTPDSCSAASSGPESEVSEAESETSVASSTLEQPVHAILGAVHGLLFDKYITQGHKRTENPFRSLLDSPQHIAKHFNYESSELVVSAPSNSKSKEYIKIQCHDGQDIAVEVHQPSAYSQNSVVLPLRYHFDGSSRAITEVMGGRNERIKSFYSKVWFGREIDPNLTVHSTFHGPEVTFTRRLLTDLSLATGCAFENKDLPFSSSDTLPINVGILAAWESLTQPLVLKDISGDLLALVHRSNKFEYVEGATPLSLGDTVTSTARVKAVTIEAAGKLVVVQAIIYRAAEEVMVVTSEFLFRGEFHDYETTFRRTRHQRWAVKASSDEDEAVLRDREWLHLDNDSSSIIGQPLIFELESFVTYQSIAKFGSLQVQGSVFLNSGTGERQKIGSVRFQYGPCVGNPVLDFLERKGTLVSGARVELEKPGWSGKSSIDVKMPKDGHQYSDVSKDYNPIHTSPTFARLANLPGTICHGMYTSAVAAAAFDHLVLDGDRQRFRRFEVSFVDMVLPLESLAVHLQHIAMAQGRMCFKIEVVRKSDSRKVMEADAEVEQPGTAYLFTGQGSASPGMGMDLYNSSPLAKAIWDDVDKQFKDTYGWSLLEIVKNNPKHLTVHFGGRKGRAIRDTYLSLSATVVLPDGSITQRPLLPNLTPKSASYTFSDPRGLLFVTMFTQPAILVLENVAFAVLKAKGYIHEGAMYGGHSLGELAALTSLLDRVSIWSIAQIAFYRGLIMGYSSNTGATEGAEFSMVAANPKRVGKGFTPKDLSDIVRAISAESQQLLEIANFNVEGEQYVCTGTTPNLYVLGKVLDHIAHGNHPLPSVSEKEPPEASNSLQSIIAGHVQESNRLPTPIKLERGRATIPLHGINTPFHSSHLRTTVDDYRSLLLRSDVVNWRGEIGKLAGRYVPNVIGKPFSLEVDYIQKVFDITGSPVLQKILGSIQ
ncbi:hypothetical protein ABOM_004000 [Aspergillus bombycis]|uniref:Malonyl-CoA:ACP transacylase (MAT) domain-containing protein n=1 Tax=Aspergillus bombycis TaxID=109264 RepID=A0A1F8A6B9_9EURO|nr:hypothetical protein ABOM_004000 [Aspergillus bombycis]OGM47233.1 hypothetical protein ABOM_004000 [Aspergillus bombycis]